MDLMDSDDEELPTDLDPSANLDATNLTGSSTRSTLTDRTVSVVLPPSPRTARKRTNAEVYQRPQIPQSSTTPLKTPPRRMSQFEQSGFSSQPAETQATAVATQTEVQISSQNMQGPLQPKNFVEEVQTYQQQLENEFKEFEESLSKRDTKDPLEDLDWEDLEQRYRSEIGPTEADEQAIIEELQARFQQFFLWMQVSKEKESDRAIKRLRTRVAYVQNSEQQLIQKQEHFSKVLEAFRNAMSLLSHG